MNTILQKRIKEAGHQYIQSDAVAPENMTLAFGDFINGATFALQNQWISVEEALPKTSNRFSKDVLCIDNRGCIVVAKYQDGVGWWSRSNTHWNTNGFTHWMPIPELPKGGDE